MAEKGGNALADGFFTKDGKVRPIEGEKSKSGAVVTAGVVALAVVGGGGGLGGGAALVESAGGSAGSVQVRTVQSKKAARKGQRDEAWRRMGLRPARRAARRQDPSCAVHSYGQVREFFLRMPCRSLQRTVLPLDDGRGGALVLTVAWVRMRGSAGAREFRRLVDVQGTGNVAPLGSTGPRWGGAEFTGEYYDSRRDGTLVVVAETAPARGRPSAELLRGAAEVAALLPPP